MNNLKHVLCDVPSCMNTALYEENWLTVYCSTHAGGKAPHIADWILYLGLDMGLLLHKRVDVEYNNGY